MSLERSREIFVGVRPLKLKEVIPAHVNAFHGSYISFLVSGKVSNSYHRISLLYLLPFHLVAIFPFTLTVLFQALHLTHNFIIKKFQPVSHNKENAYYYFRLFPRNISIKKWSIQNGIKPNGNTSK